MEKSQIEKELVPILDGTNRLEKMLIPLFTRLYVSHTRLFGFVFLGLCTYPIAWLYFRHVTSGAVFPGAAAIHLVVFEITNWFWSDRKHELKNLKLAVTLINYHLK
jgi:hypothetical protein